MPSLNITLTMVGDTSRMAVSGNPRDSLRKALNALNGISAGAIIGRIVSSYSTASAVQASATCTIASVLANDTVTIGKTTLTAKASPANENEWSSAGTNAQNATSLASKISAHSVIGQICQATASGAVVTITATIPGVIGNQIILVSSNGTRLAVTGSGYLASGTGGASSAPVTFGRN